jgi:hypothetical protein
MALKLNLLPPFELLEKTQDFRNDKLHSTEPELTSGCDITAKRPGIAVISGDSGDEIATDQRPGQEPRFELVAIRRGPTPSGSVDLNHWTMIVNPEKFIEDTLSSLASYVMARNLDGGHWMSDLLDEKIDALKVCGVEAEIREVQ